MRLDPAMQTELAGRLSAGRGARRATCSRRIRATSSAAAEDDAQGARQADRRRWRQSAPRLAKPKPSEREAELKAIADRVAGEASQGPGLCRKARRGRRPACTIAGESLRKTEQAEADREQKGRPYRDDPLFMYLWERGFGTKTYRANNLVRWLDGLIAGLVGYPEARPNFAMLNEIPLRLREHAERQQRARRGGGRRGDRRSRSRGGRRGRRQAGARRARLPRRRGLRRSMPRSCTLRGRSATRPPRRSANWRRAATRSCRACGERALPRALGREPTSRPCWPTARVDPDRQQDDTIVTQIDDVRQRAMEEERRDQATRRRG
ncbi:MAG: hypothetical protein V9G20_30355 [Candidatus Promineifilaceae bacterium]